MHRKPCFVDIPVSYKIYIASSPITGTIQLALPSGQDHMVFINIIIWGQHQSHSHPLQELPKHWKASCFLGVGRGCSTITFWCYNTYMLSHSRNAPPRWSWHIFVGCSLWSGCNRHVRPLQAISVAATSPSCQPRPSKIVTFYRPTGRLNCPSPFSLIRTLHLASACFP